MMQHAEFRRRFAANPSRREPELLDHRASCAECARYAADIERVDQLVISAFADDRPTDTRKPWEIAADVPRRAVWRWQMLAASLFVICAIGLTSWFEVRRAALFTEVITHADHERDVLIVSDKRVSLEKVRKTVAKAGALLRTELPISTARTCKIRGVVAPHLVMQTAEGAVALLLLPEEEIYIRRSTDKLGYRAALIPMGGHSIAVVGTSERAVEQGAAMVGNAIDWKSGG